MSKIIFREPNVKDAGLIWNLVKNNKPLDENSKYLYVLLCHEFSKTCVVVEQDSEIVGFISTFISPKNPDTLFVWQAVVDEKVRNRGIAKELIYKALSQTESEIRFIEATVTSTNKPSLRFLQNFAQELDADFIKKSLFSKEILGNEHEPEDLVRIGPIQRNLLEVTA